MAEYGMHALAIAFPYIVIPAGHLSAVGVHWQYGQSWASALLHPMAGGLRHCSYQLASTVMWAISVAACPCSMLDQPPLANLEMRSLHTISAVTGLLGAIFLLKSHLVHHHLRPVYSARTRILPYAAAACLVIVICGVLLSGMAGVLLHMLESFADRRSRVVNALLALLCVVVAVTSTHGLSGHLYHRMGQASSWRFYQPFQGGAVFIATQSAGWTLFALVCLGLMRVIHTCVYAASEHTIKAAGPLSTGIMISQLVIGASVHVYTQSEKSQMPWTVLSRLASLCSITCAFETALHRAVMLSMLFLPAHLYALMLGTILTSMPLPLAISAIVAFHVPYYMLTLRGQPHITGCRRNTAFIRYVNRHTEAAFSWWMHRCEVIKAFDGEIDPSRKLIFAYSPHGLMPAAAGYVPHLSSWLSQFPGISPVTLTAECLHYIGVVKDIVGAVGIRSVSKGPFIHALNTEKHVLMCPGGQHELLYTSDAHRQSHPNVKLCAKHRGFCRVALEQGAALVPILSLGEILQFHNAISFPWMQMKTYKLFGFPMPFLLLGHWGTPLPKRIPAIFVVGAPIEAKIDIPGQPTDTEINALHRLYNDSVIELWNQQKHLHPNYSDVTLSFDRAV